MALTATAIKALDKKLKAALSGKKERTETAEPIAPDRTNDWRSAVGSGRAASAILGEA